MQVRIILANLSRNPARPDSAVRSYTNWRYGLRIKNVDRLYWNLRNWAQSSV